MKPETAEEQPKNTVDLREKDKHAGGRPSKLTERFTEALRGVLEGDNVVLVYTDEDLIDAVNERLEEGERISSRTFKSWKSLAKEGKEGKINSVGREFLHLYKRALIKEKQNIIEALKLAKPGEWQKYAWLMERKFKEWNIKTVLVGDKNADAVKVRWVKGKDE